MNDVSKKVGIRQERPLTSDEFKRLQFDSDATEDVPADFRGIDLLINPKNYEHCPIDPAAVRGVSIEPIAPFLPKWVNIASKPKGLNIYEIPKEKIWHRGSWLDPVFIWPPIDDRKIYNDTSYPWGCVCKVITAAGTMGSGVIVGPRHVLTASHVVDWNSNGAGSVEVHRAGPAVSAVSAITKVWYYTKVPPNPGSSDVDEDYAVLITADRIGDRFGSLGVRTYDSDWDDEGYWRNIGYPTDVGGQMFPIHQRDKSLDEDEFDYGSARAMTTSADIKKGQSGGPIFGFWNDGPYVVAVVSAEGHIFLSGDENWCAGGNDLTRLVKHARNNDP